MLSQNPHQTQIGLAPMEGVTDFSMRLWIALCSPPDFAWTPFLRFTDTFPANIPELFIPEQIFPNELTPFKVIPQLMGPEVEDFIRTAEKFLPISDFVDLNCGCPSPTVTGNGSGSSLLKTVDRFQSYVERAIQELGPGKISVKMRTGYDSEIECHALVKSIASLPLAQLTIHGRSRLDRYKGSANWNLIHEMSSLVGMPVVLSGDVRDKESKNKALSSSGKIRTAVIGRGALRNPWIFGDVKNAPVLHALAAFGLLQNISITKQDRLLPWAKKGLAMSACGNSIEKWNVVIESLMKATDEYEHLSSISAIKLHARALARIKMIWGYMRSSLPVEFMEPKIMRSTSWNDFYNAVTSLAKNAGYNIEEIPLQYDASRDWLYSGEGRGS